MKVEEEKPSMIKAELQIGMGLLSMGATPN